MTAADVAAHGAAATDAAANGAAMAEAAMHGAAASGDGPGAVLVTGGTGFVGSALVARLRHAGRDVIVLSRDPRGARRRLDEAVRVVGSLDELGDETRLDAIVHLAGAPVIGPPWTAARRRVLRESRLGITAALMALFGRLRVPPRVLVAASAVGYYGVPVDGEGEGPPCDETAPPAPGQFASDLCVALERVAMAAQRFGVRVVCARFGLVLGRDGGAFPAQALAARLGLGAVVGSGRQPMPWVHVDDACALVDFAIATPALQGPVNVVAPGSATQADFARALAAAVGRRVWLRVPGAPLRLAGGEMMSLLLDGRAVVPVQALRHGFRFRHATLAGACADLVAPARTLERQP
jgi:uncharacterized protein (TIGR01777 family)